jgi:hypothetical protein
MQPHVDLEAIVSLHSILSDICAGAQVNLTIQFICLEQEVPQWSNEWPGEPTPLIPAPARGYGHMNGERTLPLSCLTSSAVESL